MTINYKILTILWAVVILVLSITPGNYIPQVEFELIAPDTIAHIIFYFVLIFLLANWKSEANMIFLFIIAILYGSLIEVVQGALIPGRFFDMYDIISNTLGCISGLIFHFIYLKLKK